MCELLAGLFAEDLGVPRKRGRPATPSRWRRGVRTANAIRRRAERRAGMKPRNHPVSRLLHRGKPTTVMKTKRRWWRSSRKKKTKGGGDELLAGLFAGIWECPASGGGEQRHLAGGEEFGRRIRSGEGRKEAKESSCIMTAPSKKADDRDEDEEAVVEVIQKEEDQGWRRCGRSPTVCFRCRGRRRCEETFLPAHQHLAGLFAGIWECPTSGGGEQRHLAGGEEFGRQMRSGEGRKEAKESSGITTAPSKKADDRDEDEEAVVEVIQKEEDQGWRRCGRSPAVCLRCQGKRRCEETFLPTHQYLAGLFIGIWECPASGGGEQRHLAGGEEFGRRMRSGEGWKEGKESSVITTAPSKKADDRDEDEEAVVEVIQKKKTKGGGSVAGLWRFV